MKQFCYIGISFKHANIQIREQAAFTDGKKMEFLAQAEGLGIRQCIILSTCNRSEVFFFDESESDGTETENDTETADHLPGADSTEKMRKLYLSLFPEADLGAYLNMLQGESAYAYFFRITAGLESLVVGEDQILGQVKDAYEFSKALGYTRKELNRVVQDAMACAKNIKTELKISEVPLSVSYIGIRMVDKLCRIKGRSALVIGSGKTAVLAIRYLFYYGAAKVVVCSRTLAHAKELLAEFPQLSVVPYEQRYEQLGDCRLIISATASPHVVLRKERLEAHVKPGMVFLDLASPRDIDPGIRKLAGLSLIDLDTLEQIADENQSERVRLMSEGEQRIAEAVQETQRWLLGSGIDKTIQSLQQRCDEIVEDTYGYLNRKLELESREQKILKKMLRASLKRLIREPILELKQLDSPQKQQEYQRVVQELFQIHER